MRYQELEINRHVGQKFNDKRKKGITLKNNCIARRIK